MLFNSIEFLIFFPVVTALYFLLPHKWRWLLLLIASIVFYMFFIPAYILILFVTIIIDYFAGIWIARSDGRKKKLYLVGSIISTCMVLFVFKYYNFFIDNFNGIADLIGWNYSLKALSIILPIGLSFHTFQSLSYVVEVYRGNQKPEHSFGIYSLYVMFYPQLVAGPIERPQNMLHQFYEKHSLNYADFSKGGKLIIWGLFKKVVIADNLSVVVQGAFDHTEQLSWWWLLLCAYFFALQIYCDFSGYSDIARGTARVMGFELMENFNTPYLARSIREFWGRWHISLSTWFKDYVYIPLGGNRVSSARLNMNLLTVFAISGFWHGANWTFVIWGALHGMYQVVERWVFKLKAITDFIKSNHFIARFLTMMFVFHLVVLGWIFFRAANVDDAMYYIQRMLSFAPQTEDLPREIKRFGPYGMAFKVFLAGSFFILDPYLHRLTRGHYQRVSYIAKMMIYAFLLAMILLVGFWGDVQFIYFQF